MRAAILCGGRGTRAYPHTVDLPKPLLEVAGQAVLLHVMEIYAAHGVDEFVLAAGFRADLLHDWATTLERGWSVEVVDTGLETATGERLRRCLDHLGPTFFATYGDGLGDVDLDELLAFHRERGGVATLTTVPMPSPYGTVGVSASGAVERFTEKPRLPDHPINAGFFVFDRAAFSPGTGVDLEREVLPHLAAAGSLFARPHHGFWRSLDTYKDALELSELCASGTPPWLPSAPSVRP